jgi:hypothetical protein
MTCCEEYGCKRQHPIALYLGDFSGQVFAATRMRVVNDHGDGTATFSATEKHEVTSQMRRFIRDNPGWVREELAKADDNVASVPVAGDNPAVRDLDLAEERLDARRRLDAAVAAARTAASDKDAWAKRPPPALPQQPDRADTPPVAPATFNPVPGDNPVPGRN